MKKRLNGLMLMLTIVFIALGNSASAENTTKGSGNDFYAQHNFIAQASQPTQDKFDSTVAVINTVAPSVNVIPQDSILGAVKEAINQGQNLKGASIYAILGFCSLIASLILSVVGFFMHKNVKAMVTDLTKKP